MQQSRRQFLPALFIAATSVSGCSDGPTRPSGSLIEGTYAPTAFTVTTPDTVFDELAEGDSLTLTLHADGSTSGSLLIPDSRTDLAGRWDTSDATLHLRLAARSFLTRIPFAVGDGKLMGDLLSLGDTIHLSLTK